MSDADRRRFRRVNAPVLCRPVGLFFREDKRQVQDISRGGFRVYSDDTHRPGQRLELEFFFTDGTSATVRAQVVWIERLPPEAGAQFDVGFKYIDASANALDRIEHVLGEVG